MGQRVLMHIHHKEWLSGCVDGMFVVDVSDMILSRRMMDG